MDKKYLYYGGGGVALLLLVLFIRKRSITAAENVVADDGSGGTFYSPLPISGGISSGGGGYDAGTITGGAIGGGYSGSESVYDTTSMGASNLDALIASMFGSIASPVTTDASKVIANQHTQDSQILAGIMVAPGSTAAITHTATGSQLTITDNIAAAAKMQVEKLVSDMYASIGRTNVDAVGEAYWEQRVASGENIASINNSFIDSATSYRNDANPDISTAAKNAAMIKANRVTSDLYASIGRQNVDAEGMAYWNNRVVAGENISTIRNDFLNAAASYKNDPNADIAASALRAAALQAQR